MNYFGVVVFGVVLWWILGENVENRGNLSLIIAILSLILLLKITFTGSRGVIHHSEVKRSLNSNFEPQI